MSDTNSSLPHFVGMLDHSNSLNVLKSECLSTWDCSWLFTVYLFFINLKMVCKSLYKYKSSVLISNFFQLYYEKRLCTHLDHVSEVLKQTKGENDSLSDHLFFYRLWHIRSFIHLSLDIIDGFRIDASGSRFWYSHIQLCFTLLMQKWNDVNYLPWIR